METVRILLLSFIMLIDKGTTCRLLSPQCYKSSTRPSHDFLCEWEDRERSQGAIYTLFLRNIDKNCSTYAEHFPADEKLSVMLPLESLRTTCLLDIWVHRKIGSMTCNSSPTTVVLMNSVKYSSPDIQKIQRKAGSLILSWPRPDDKKGAIHEVRWRKINGSWQNDTFVTKDNKNEVIDTNESYNLLLEKHAVYEVQIRRKAMESLLWSNWSRIYDIPIEIEQPVVQWKLKKQVAGKREIILSWDEPPSEASFGGVTYNLTLDLPCKKQNKTTRNTTYEMSVTYSEARVSVVAINNVGNSSSQQIVISPVKHLKYCHTETLPQKPQKHYCLEWYMLKDGETRPAKVNTSSSAELKTITNSMENFVRYYYYLHTGRKQHTEIMCPIYSMEGKPGGQPQNVTILNMTHDSAVLSWKPIPVQDQHGFLKNYLIWISTEGKIDTAYYEVPANETSFLFGKLVEGSSYMVHIAGQTKIGAGPNYTMIFTVVSSAKNASQIKIILSVLGVLVILLSAIPFAVRWLRSKLLPVIPRPVISASAVFLENQDRRALTEEVQNVILLCHADQDKTSQNKNNTSRLQDCEGCLNEDEEEKNEETNFTELGFIGKLSSYPNPNYKGQMLKLPEPLEVTYRSEGKSCEVRTPSYKSGLFFEARVLENEGMS